MKFLTLFAALLLAQDAERVDVQFEPGSSSATYTDTIRGYQSVEYIVHAEEGQKLAVRLSSSNMGNYINIYAPDAPEVEEAMHEGPKRGNRFEGSLSKAGDYRVQVFLMNNAAHRDETAEFTLKLELFWAATVDSGGELDVRSGTSTSDDVVASLENGTAVRNLGCTMVGDTEWCHVALEDDSLDGWVERRFLRETAPP